MTKRLACRSEASDRRRFVHFVAIGLVNTAVGFGIFAVLHRIGGLPAQYALAISFVLGVLWNFWTHARFVFDHRGIRRLPAYMLTYIGIYGFNALCLESAMRAHISPIIAQAFLTLVSAVLSFFLISRVLTGRFPLSPRSDQA